MKLVRERWKQEEVNFLKEHYNSFGAKFCALHLKTSTGRIRIKASRLKIIKPLTGNEKVCLECYKRKKLTEFSPHKQCQFGIQSKCKTCRSKWESNRKKNDKDYRVLQNIRNRIRIAMKKNCKKTSSKKLLGCSILELKSFISSKFLEGMSWENHGEWHIDHIRPCSSFDLTDPEQQKVCFHYSNLQPLWAKDNLSKGSKWII